MINIHKSLTISSHTSKLYILCAVLITIDTVDEHFLKSVTKCKAFVAFFRETFYVTR